MISLNKKSKPNILVEKEVEWTIELLSYLDSGLEIPTNVKSRYRHPEIKEALKEETSSKCAYCESKITHIDHGDIEHIIPKSIVPKKTFTWENLTLGCKKCNQNKSNYHNENVPLLNPYDDKPEERIIFMGSILFAPKGDMRAYTTIKKLKLNRPELIERRSELINQIHPLIWEYENSQDEILKELVLEDLIELTKPDKEFSLMVFQLLNKRAVTI